MNNAFITTYFKKSGVVINFAGQTLGIPIHVYGPETHMTAVVAYALRIKESPPPQQPTFSTANFLLPGGIVRNDGN